MKSWVDDKAWADGYLPEIRRVLGLCAQDILAVSIADAEWDAKKATDYVVTTAGGDVACRIRDWDAWKRYHDITLRYSRRSGVKTEVGKILDGHGDYYLYAWAKGGSFGAWVFLDLDALRATGLLDRPPRPPVRNRDGGSSFIGLRLPELTGCVVRAGGEAAWVCNGARADSAGGA